LKVRGVGAFAGAGFLALLPGLIAKLLQCGLRAFEVFLRRLDGSIAAGGQVRERLLQRLPDRGRALLLSLVDVGKCLSAILLNLLPLLLELLLRVLLPLDELPLRLLNRSVDVDVVVEPRGCADRGLFSLKRHKVPRFDRSVFRVRPEPPQEALEAQPPALDAGHRIARDLGRPEESLNRHRAEPLRKASPRRAKRRHALLPNHAQAGPSDLGRELQVTRHDRVRNAAEHVAREVEQLAKLINQEIYGHAAGAGHARDRGGDHHDASGCEPQWCDQRADRGQYKPDRRAEHPQAGRKNRNHRAQTN